jgi:hypothetical protein
MKSYSSQAYVSRRGISLLDNQHFDQLYPIEKPQEEPKKDHTKHMMNLLKFAVKETDDHEVKPALVKAAQEALYPDKVDLNKLNKLTDVIWSEYNKLDGKDVSHLSP